jgi:ribosomal protein L44E
MIPIPQEVHKQITKKIVTYCRHCKAWTSRTSVERFHQKEN